MIEDRLRKLVYVNDLNLFKDIDIEKGRIICFKKQKS